MPYKVLYDRKPPALLSYIADTAKEEQVNKELNNRDTILKELRQQFQAFQSRMKQFYDWKWKEVHFEVGDMVYLQLQPYHQTSIALRQNQKMAPHFCGL